jgi:hypothetical protein
MPAFAATETEAESLVRFALRRRGIRCGRGRHEGAILPRSRAGRATFYELLKRYSFRLFLRDLIRLKNGATADELARYSSPATARGFLRSLREIGVVRAAGRGRWGLTDRTIHSFGPTLEWFVAEALRRELGVPTAWGLRPAGAAGGGDYDVVACADGALIYVEVKSSAPRNIDRSQIGAFVDRAAELAPDVAILLNDTQLRMLDKLVPALGGELRRRPFVRGRIRRLHGEIFACADRLFVTNSEPDLVGNVVACLAHFYRRRAGGR